MKSCLFSSPFFYPFGSIMPNSAQNLNAGDHTFGFNGKMDDKEMYSTNGTSYDFGARLYNSRLGRWFATDGLEHDARLIGQSPYSFAFNSPIMYNDDGNIPWNQVLKFVKVTSQQGWRMHPKLHKLKYHGGMDLAAPSGSDVRALAGGKIVKIGWDVKVNKRGVTTGYGRYVIIQHPKGYYSLYGHLEKNSTNELKKGDFISNGQVFAKSGNTGGSTGAHLHLEIVKSDDLIGVFKDENKLDPEVIGDLDEIINGVVYGPFMLKESKIEGKGDPNMYVIQKQVDLIGVTSSFRNELNMSVNPAIEIMDSGKFRGGISEHLLNGVWQISRGIQNTFKGGGKAASREVYHSVRFL